ncbi:MAG: fibronectin type III domain-containing protein [Bacteroidetes bacterium]|nr:fibronectin type III domain-containing protein [Bacteroidota bacterium]
MKANSVNKILKYLLVLLLLNAPLTLIGAGIELVFPSNYNLCVVEGEIECSWNYDNPTNLPLSDVVISFYKDTTLLVASEEIEDNETSFLFNSFDFPEMSSRAAYKWEVVATIGSITYRAVRYFYMIPRASYGANSLEDDAQCVATSIKFDWTPEVAEHDYFYEVQLSKNNSFDVLVPVITKPEYLTIADAELEYNTKYFWRLRDINCPNNFSDIRTFHTIKSAATLLEPENFTTCLTIKEDERLYTSLIWSSDISLNDNYILKIYDAESNILIDSLLLLDQVYKFDITDLPNKEIKWQVQLIQNAGTDPCVADWSETYYFYTPLEMPEIISMPVTNSKCVPLNNAELRWRSNLSDDYYIQIAIYNSQNDSLITIINAPNTKSYIMNNILQYQHQYYYKMRIRTADLFGEDYIYSEWTGTDSFETTTPGPNLISPENNLFGAMDNIELMWQEVPNAEYYILEVCSDNAFNKQQASFYQDIPLQETQIGFPLHPGISYYYWRVKARIGDCESDYTEIRNFSSALAVPEIIFPENLSVENSNYVLIKWRLIENAKYDVEYSKYKYAFDSLYSLVSTITYIVGDEVTLYSLDTNTTYYWRIRAKNDIASSSWSEIYEFKTGYEEPYKVTLSTPIDKVNYIRYGTYRWQPTTHVQEYKLEFSTEQNFSYCFGFIVPADQTSYTLESNMFDEEEFPALLHNTKYYWRVCGVNKTAIGAWSDAREFTTFPKITYVNLVGPTHNDTNVSYDNARFRWQTVGARAYRLVVLDANDNTILDSLVADVSFGSNTTMEVVYTQLEKNTNYKWKVFASEDGVAQDNTNGEEGAWSGTWLFKTINTGGILDNSFISSLNIVPNPASNFATLMVYANETGNATMTIADINGNIVSTEIINLDLGENLVGIHTNSLPAANYTLLLHINSKLVGTTSFIIAR